MSQTGGTPLVRRLNESAILENLHEYGPLTRPELVSALGLSSPTVTRIVTKLAQENLIVEKQLANSTGGRRAALLEFNRHAGSVVALDLSQSNMLSALLDLDGGPIFRHTSPISDGQDAINQLMAEIEGILARKAVERLIPTAEKTKVVIALEKANDVGTNLEDYAGLGRKYPALAACMTVFMLSFTGVPPTLGFVGKLFLFRTAIEGGMVGLAVIGVLTSLISAYYYLRVVIIMYFRDGDPSIRSEGWLNLTVAASAVAVVVFSLFSSPLFEWAAGAVVK